MSRPKRADQIADIETAIKNTAWTQIAEFGAPALSLRAIARELRITAPAIYNYFPSRDYLVTALIVEAFTSFGDSQMAALEAIPADDLIGRLEAIGLAYRQWAIIHPQRYQLIFGTPIPGYSAPMEQILPASVRSLKALVSVLDALRTAGRLRTDSFPKISPGYEGLFAVWKEYGGDVENLALSVALLIWSRVHGLVSLEIGGHLPPFGADGDGLYRYELDSLKRQFVAE